SADSRSDIYSLGAVAYFLLSGQPPFVRSTVGQMIDAHEKEQPIPLSLVLAELDRSLASVVMRCLEKEPSQRYQNIQALERDLGACPSAKSWGEEEAARFWMEHLAKDAPPAASAAADVTKDSNDSLVGTLDVTSDIGRTSG